MHSAVALHVLSLSSITMKGLRHAAVGSDHWRDPGGHLFPEPNVYALAGCCYRRKFGVASRLLRRARPAVCSVHLLSRSICLGVTLAACSPGDRTAAPPVVSDSAGVRIIENTARACPGGDSWAPPAQPVLSIGAVEGPPEYLLSFVRGAGRLGDERIAVADAGSSSIRFYSSDGAFLSSSGRQGRGPGEYLDIARLGRLPGDTIVVVDGMAQRISFLDSSGTYVRSIGLPLVEGFYNAGLYNAVGIRDDGRILAYSTSGRGFREEDAGRLIRDSLHFFWFDRTGERGGRLIGLPGAPRWGLRVGGAVSFPYVPFGGGPVSGVGRDRFVVGRGVEAELLVFGADGELDRVIRWAGGRRASGSEVDLLHDAMLGSDVTDAQRRANRRLLSEAPLPDRLPAARDVVVAETGHIWVERYRAPWELESIWEVFDRDGVWLGTVHAPPRFRLHEIGRNYLLGTWRDELNVEHVRLYSWTIPACDPHNR